jgi:hypothetical protein
MITKWSSACKLGNKKVSLHGRLTSLNTLAVNTVCIYKYSCTNLPSGKKTWLGKNISINGGCSVQPCKSTLFPWYPCSLVALYTCIYIYTFIYNILFAFHQPLRWNWNPAN